MSALEKSIAQMSMRQEYRNRWHVQLMETPGEDPAFFCMACICGPCASYMLRQRALYDDMTKYVCCAGYMPCSGRCGESNCPEMCLCAEVFCCFNNSVSSTRFLLQDEFNIQTSGCDNCIIGTMVCVSQLACICSIIACLTGASEAGEAAQLLGCIADIITCVVCPCMQTQAKIEMDKRDGLYGERSVMEVPPVQQMSRLDQPIPPGAGYPAPPIYDEPRPPKAEVYQTYPPPHGDYPPPSHGDYPPPSQGYPAPSQAQGYPPPQSHGYPPPQGQAYPPPQGQHYPPPQGQHYPPPQGQHYPPANYPPPSY